MPLLRKKSSPSVTKNFWENRKSSKVVTPYALKEFKTDGYLFADYKSKDGFFFLENLWFRPYF